MIAVVDIGREYVVRTADESDISEIMSIERASFPTPWHEVSMRSELTVTADGESVTVDASTVAAAN